MPRQSLVDCWFLCLLMEVQTMMARSLKCCKLLSLYILASSPDDSLVWARGISYFCTYRATRSTQYIQYYRTAESLHEVCSLCETSGGNSTRTASTIATRILHCAFGWRNRWQQCFSRPILYSDPVRIWLHRRLPRSALAVHDCLSSPGTTFLSAIGFNPRLSHAA